MYGIPVYASAHAQYSLSKPHVCNSPCTYTRTYPSGPCTPYVTAQCTAQICDLTHPVISLMPHNSDDIEQVICVTTTLLRGVSIKLKLSNGGHFCEKQD